MPKELKWPVVIKKVVARIRADSELETLMGGQHIYRNRTRSRIQIPGIYWTHIYEVPFENTSEIKFQFDYWGYGIEQVANIESRMYALFHFDTHTQFDGLDLWSQYAGSRNVYEDTADVPEEEYGVEHKSDDYIFIPGRERTLS
jgi:hypothetical protein